MIGNLYKFLEKIDDSSCNQVVDPEIDKVMSCVADSTMLCYR